MEITKDNILTDLWHFSSMPTEFSPKGHIFSDFNIETTQKIKVEEVVSNKMTTRTLCTTDLTVSRNSSVGDIIVQGVLCNPEGDKCVTVEEIYDFIHRGD